ncbi:hypothetical protein LTR56_001759 [Elasticomyces elasticus]|nr:hypothetical protein LTR56_001759 [Elasticomyces elasticus]KAK3668890.1 hypothetical protein LTR22_000370 [Elasticomyces elasticus]KAK4925006.1 hypothetical protein LTR49_008012 [Elasticomyces elasticus]KAK5763263.1 hypothetical protein LTS12_006647 [Elasticomyces elasticus]
MAARPPFHQSEYTMTIRRHRDPQMADASQALSTEQAAHYEHSGVKERLSLQRQIEAYNPLEEAENHERVDSDEEMDEDQALDPGVAATKESLKESRKLMATISRALQGEEHVTETHAKAMVLAMEHASSTLTEWEDVLTAKTKAINQKLHDANEKSVHAERDSRIAEQARSIEEKDRKITELDRASEQKDELIRQLRRQLEQYSGVAEEGHQPRTAKGSAAFELAPRSPTPQQPPTMSKQAIDTLQRAIRAALHEEFPHTYDSIINEAVDEYAEKIACKVMKLKKKKEHEGVRPLKLMDLPAELRTSIWEYAVTAACRLHVGGNDDPDDGADRPTLEVQPAITRVSKQIRKESLALFYTLNKFAGSVEVHLDDGIEQPLAKWFQAIGDEHAALVKKNNFRAWYWCNIHPDGMRSAKKPRLLLDCTLDPGMKLKKKKRPHYFMTGL